MNRLVVFYDDWCPNCTRFAMLVKKIDWLSLIEIQKMRDLETTTSGSNFPVHQQKHPPIFFADNLDFSKAQKQMASFETKNVKEPKNKNVVSQPAQIFYGFISIYKILLRLPIYWGLFFYTFPFLFLIKISGMGDFFYNQIAIKRRIIPLHCDENCKTIHNENKK